jgi:hypothetical protein
MATNITGPEVVVSCLIAIALFAAAVAVWCFIERRRLAAEERGMQHDFEQNMKAVELPPWNGEEYELAPDDTLPAWDGDTYEWTPESLAYLADTDTYEQPLLAAPVPPSDISGPLPTQDIEPEYDPVADAQAYMTEMRREHDLYMARLLEEAR